MNRSSRISLMLIAILSLSLTTLAQDPIPNSGFEDWTFQRWSLKSIITPNSGGDSIHGSHKGIWIWQRQKDGYWKLSRSIWNSNNPIQPIQ